MLIDKRLYDFSAGIYCGVFIPEKVMKKIAKLNAKYVNEVRKVLDDNKNELYPQEWTLANRMDGADIKKQVIVRYTLTSSTQKDVEKRIALFKAPLPHYEPEVFMVDSHKEAQEIAEKKLENV